MSTAGLLEELRRRQIVGGAAPALPDAPQERPWFIALLQGMAGWVSGLLLLVFVWLLGKPDTTVAIVILGLLLVAGAWVLYILDRSAVFLDQLALAVSIAGQLALAWAILKELDSTAVAALSLLALQCAVFVVMPNNVARTIAAFFACIAWTYAVRFLLWPGAGADAFFDRYGEVRAPVFGSWTTPVGWLLTWAPIIALAVALLVYETRWMARRARVFARPALTGTLLGAALASFAGDPMWTMLGGSTFAPMQNQPLSMWALLPLLSIALTMFVAHCAFRLRSFGLLGIAVFAALLRLSMFYYQYGTTLLAKAAVMLMLGVVLLGGGIALQKRAREPA